MARAPKMAVSAPFGVNCGHLAPNEAKIAPKLVESVNSAPNNGKMAPVMRLLADDEFGGADADGNGVGLAFDRADEHLRTADEGVDGQRLRGAGGITRSATGAGTRAFDVPELRVAVTPAEEFGAGDAHFERRLIGPHIDHDDILAVAFQLVFVRSYRNLARF